LKAEIEQTRSLSESFNMRVFRMIVQDVNLSATGVEETSGTGIHRVSSFLFSLPPELSTTVLVYWLDLTDVARLDSAMCTRNERGAFLTVYGSSHAVYDYLPHMDQLLRSRSTTPYDKPEFLRWVLLREVRLSSLESDPLSKAELRVVLADVIRMSRSFLKTLRTRGDFTTIGSTLADNCTSLERLSFGYIIDAKQARVLDELLSKCPALQHLMFYAADSHASQVIAKYGHQIQSLNMAGDREGRSNSPEYAVLLPHLPNLTELNILGLYSTTMLTAVARHCPQLRVLRTAAGMDRENRQRVDAAFRSLAQACRDLEVLDLGTHRPIGEKVLLEFLRNCRKLTVLLVSTVTDVSDETLELLGQNFPALRELYVRSRSIVTRHIARWPLLEELDVGCISDQALRKLAAHCPRLRVLIADRCQLVTESGVLALAEGCPLLQRVYFHCNTELTTVAANAIRTFDS
jgi:hypothetical protein